MSITIYTVERISTYYLNPDENAFIFLMWFDNLKLCEMLDLIFSLSVGKILQQKLYFSYLALKIKYNISN